MSILVSGGAGYIGSHTCVELLQAGYEIEVAANFYNSSPLALERVKTITDKDAVEKILPKTPTSTASSSSPPTRRWGRASPSPSNTTPTTSTAR